MTLTPADQLTDGKPIKVLPGLNEPSARWPSSGMPLLFLMRLQHEQLPVRVAEPEEIRHVSVLLATGLIDANIVALKSTARYASPRLATVVRITEEGRAQIAELGDVPKPATTSTQLAHGLRLM